jgi:cytochrome c2
MILICGGIMASLAWGQSSTATLDQMIAAGKSQRELAQHLFDTQGCRKCHTIGKEEKLGFTKEGQERAQSFEGCISTLKAMTVIVKVPESQRSATQTRRVQRFQEFGCATCHKVSPGKMGLTETGAKLAGLHLGCVEVEKLVASGPRSTRWAAIYCCTWRDAHSWWAGADATAEVEDRAAGAESWVVEQCGWVCVVRREQSYDEKSVSD